MSRISFRIRVTTTNMVKLLGGRFRVARLRCWSLRLLGLGPGAHARDGLSGDRRTRCSGDRGPLGANVRHSWLCPAARPGRGDDRRACRPV